MYIHKKESDLLLKEKNYNEVLLKVSVFNSTNLN